MSSVFSVDEIGDSFFNSAAGEGEVPLGRSQSEWALHRVLEEVSSSTSPTPERLQEDTNQVFGGGGGGGASFNTHADPVHRHAYLSNRLDMACAAFLRSRESAVNARDSVSFPASQQVLVPSQLRTPAIGSTVTQSSASNGPFAPAAEPIIPRNAGIQVKQTTSESSREDSDDDELEGDTGTTENKDPAEDKRMRRMQSNRESARRSRRRKQVQMNELETQVGQLKVEHSTLLKRLTDINHNYDEASVDNRILKADIETLRAKVKMAEETVKRVTGINPLLFVMSNLTTDIPLVNSPIDSFPGPAAAIPSDSNSHHFFHPTGSNMNSHHPALDNSFPSNNSVPATSKIQESTAGIASSLGAISGWNLGVPQSYAGGNLKQK
ncbi:hypothetical protein MLD38_028084 [Melastoma candidum]|uniref:Uncharacterized protein n=1 Tax=Melastoma candidum TaxID=119954 RepID=A0ACB9N299_9MYRT|nr:hypothetical protein MLD38_028084 [Melastoma candidum]